MNFSQSMEFWTKLFELISIDEENQQQISHLLNTFSDKDTLKAIINTPIRHKEGDETMLMWAVLRLKKQTVIDLLEYGANPFYKNQIGESVSTYWDFGFCEPTDSKQYLACEIAEILHNANVNLLAHSHLSYGLVRRAKEYKLEILQHKLKQLGY